MQSARIAAVAFISLAAHSADAGCTLGKLAELPVTMFESRPYVHAKINGNDIRLLVDSGSVFGLLSSAAAAELKLSTRPAPTWFYAKGVGGVVDVRFATAKDFSLDTIPLHNVDFMVGGSVVGADLAGVLGRNILNYADTEYDLANGAVRMMRGSGCAHSALAYWAGTKVYQAIDTLGDEQRYPATVVAVTVNGLRLRAIMDTGASASVITLSAARRAGLPTSGPDVIERGAGGGIGRRNMSGFVSPVGEFDIGDEKIKNTKLQVFDTSFAQSDMVLGADFFLSHRVFVASSQQKVYFTYNGGPVFSLVATPIDSPAASAPSEATAVEVKGEPTDAGGYSRRGEAYASRRDFAKAIVDLDRAVALAPAEPDYLYQRAVVRLSAGQMFLAMSDVEQALKLRPDNSDARLLRAQLRFAGHQKSEAVADVDEVAKTASPAADLRLRLAGFYQLGDRLESAVEQYTLWIAAHPDDRRRPIALNGRCWARALLNRDLDKALADCNAAVRSNPKSYSFLDSRGLVFFRMDEFARSIADFDASLAVNPKVAWSLYGRGLAKMKSGNADGGKADVAAALAVNSNMATEAARYGVKP